MSKFGTWVGLSVDASNLAELLCDEVSNEIGCTLGEQENVILTFQKLGDVLVLLN
jgi:hypothetical protein